MIVSCLKCGSRYNAQTVERCPACHPTKGKQAGRIAREDRGEIRSFMRASIGEKRKLVNSFRKSEVTKWEREHGKQIY